MNVLPDGTAYGQLQKCQYAAHYEDDGTKHDSVAVTFLTPKENVQTRTYGDGAWGINNQQLQLLAAIGKRPSDYDGMTLSLIDENVPIPLTYKRINPEQGWHLSQGLFDRGREALRQVSWVTFGSNITINVGGTR